MICFIHSSGFLPLSTSFPRLPIPFSSDRVVKRYSRANMKVGLHILSYTLDDS